MKSKTITFQEYNNQINKYNQLRAKGLKPIYKRNWFKIGLGCLCLTIAIIPNGLGFVFYPLSLMFLGFSLFDLKHIYLSEIKRKIKNKVFRK